MHRVARFDELGPPSAAAPTAGSDRLDTGMPDEDAVRPVAPVAELGAADGQCTSGSAMARLGDAGGWARPHQEALLIVPDESVRTARAYPLDDQQGGRGRQADGGGRERRERAAGGGAFGDGGDRDGGDRDGAGRGGAPAEAGGGRRRRRDGPTRPGEGGADGRPAQEPGGRRRGPKQIDPDADPVAAAREICLRLLTDRARTRHELARALQQRGVPDEAAGSVLERFDEVGLIDDAAFAGQWVRSRHHHRGLARRAIAMELRRKGVEGEVAEEALGEVDDDAEARRARELVDRKLRTVPADTPEQRKKAANRLVGMLARKGYGGGVAYRVVREALAAHGAELDELGTDPID